MASIIKRGGSIRSIWRVVWRTHPSNRPALLVPGTILRGGMQTRMVAGSALLPTNQPVALPVSCVE